MTPTKEEKELNIIFIGHEDHGKSTLTGQLLIQLQVIKSELLEKTTKESIQTGDPNNKFNWLLDNEEERNLKGSIYLKQNHFSTTEYNITIMDAPGKRDFLKNLISGTCQADVAILVVSAIKEEFELGISVSGQTREHLLLANTLGVKQIIVVINKMEEIGFKKEVYDQIVKNLFSVLKKVGYNPSGIPFVPISALNGENITKESEPLKWFEGWEKTSKLDGIKKGKTLLDAINALDNAQRSIDKPLRFTVQDSYIITGVGTVAVGKIETGIIEKNLEIVINPGNIVTKVNSIEKNNSSLETAKAGEMVALHLNDVQPNQVKRGMVLSSPSDNPAFQVTSFVSQIIVLNSPNHFVPGFVAEMDIHTTHVPCKLSVIQDKVDRKSGKVIENLPQSLALEDAAIVRFVPQKPLVVEMFKEFPQLGRFALRDNYKTVAIGVIKSIEKLDL